MSICVIEPHPNQWRGMLAQSHITPQRVEEIKIEKIEVDITRQTWRIFLAEEILDGTVLQDLEQAFRDLCPQLQGISFVSPPRGDDEGAYLERILRENQQQPLVSLPEIQSDVLIGRGIKGEPRPIKEIVDEERSITIKGQVISLEVQELRSGRTLLTFDITDYTDSITAKIFLKDGEPVPERLQKGQWITVRGPVEIDRYSQELVLMAKDISLAERPKRVDNAPVKRTELHFHTKMSSMDATAELKAAMQVAADWGHEALAITDHGVVQAFPEAYELGRALGLKVIYGTEGYLVEKEREDPSYHIILLAQNQRGLKNLYKLISLAHLKYFYRQPRIPREEIMKHREGLILGSACERGEVYQAILRGASDEELINIAKFYDYLEIQPLANNRFLVREGRVSSEEELQQINRRIVELAQQLNIPVVATGDVHFVHPEDAIYRQILLAGQGYADVEHQAPLYLRTTEEMLEEFAYLGPEVAYKVVVEDPKGIVASIEELQPIPDGLHTPHMPGAEESITETAYRRARELYGQELPPLVEARLERELRAICDNGYAPLYLIAQKLVEKSLSDGYLVGSRGSVGSSLVATLCNITEVNPLPPHYLCPSCHYSEFIDDGSVGVGVDLDDQDCPDCGQTMDKLGFDIPFEVFMGFHGDKVPDIDLNFSGEYQPIIHKYTEELFGPEYVYRAGTISTLADRTAYGFVRKFLDEHDIQVRDAELNRLVQGCSGVKRTTGQHPGGLMVVPNDREIFDFSPIQYPANDKNSGVVTTHFDYHAISERLVKLDILGHEDPTTLRMLKDLTGIDPQGIPLDDPQTMSIFSGTDALGVTPEDINCPVGTLGIPEFGTRFVRQMLEDTKPKTFNELVRISGFSHGTNVWANNAQDLIRSGIATTAEAIACRDDIMLYLIRQGMEAGHAFRIMEQVRKGRGLTDEDIKAMVEHGVPQWYIESCQKISYMFPKAHAVAYVTMAFRIAYYKVHYPEAFYIAYFSCRAADFDAQLVKEGRVGEEMAAINRKANEATAKEKSVLTVLEVVNEALARGIKFLTVDLYKSDAKCFQGEPDGLRPPLIALQGLGETAADNIVRCREEGSFTSIEDLRRKCRLTKTVIEILATHGALEGLPAQDQLTLF